MKCLIGSAQFLTACLETSAHSFEDFDVATFRNKDAAENNTPGKFSAEKLGLKVPGKGIVENLTRDETKYVILSLSRNFIIRVL